LENPTISKRILDIQNVRVWNAFMWLKTGANYLAVTKTDVNPLVPHSDDNFLTV